MTVSERLKSTLGSFRSRLFSPRGKPGNGSIPLQALLSQMDTYEWGSVEDIPVNEDERRERLRYFNEVIYASGVKLNGSILDLASGVTSLGYLYPNVVAVDNDPQKVKRLRENGVRGIVADIESLPFEEKSFDYVVSISPPLKPIILHKDGYVRFVTDQEYNRRIVNAALRIARKRVLIASYFITSHPPYEDLIEKRDGNGLYWVLYKASDKEKTQDEKG